MGITNKTKRLRKGDIANFKTLKQACSNNNLALMKSTRISDGAEVALVCAMNRGAGGSVGIVPLAVMVEGNPFDLFTPPTDVDIRESE